MPNLGGEGRSVADRDGLDAATLSPAFTGDTLNPPSTAGDAIPTPIPSTEVGPLVPPAPLPDPSRYHIVAKIGEGGMGMVYRARDRLLGRDVALKVIRPAALTSEMRRRFDTEARSVARLDHPHVVKVFDVGERPDESGRPAPFLALEFVPGGSLGRKLTLTPLPPPEAARLVRLLAKAVAHAHERGIIHRDLKPDNVLVAAAADEPSLNCSWGVPKITDFGLARAIDGSGPTRAGDLMGTPQYMAPEQAECRTDVGPAADVYALGVILYRLLAGKPPFESKSLTELLYKVVYEAPPDLTAVGPQVPEGLRRLCLECLAKVPADRPTAAALAEQLENWQAPSSEPSPMLEVMPRRQFVRSRWFWTAIASVVLMGLIGAVAWTNRSGGPTVASSVPTVEAASVPAEPLRVLSLEVEHFAARPGGAVERLGLLGRDSFRPMLGDKVRVRAKLSRPSYAYIIACQADGGVELCFPESDSEVPPLTAEPCYPSRNRDEFYGLREGAGLWTFTVLASDRLLRPYRDWLAGRAVPWKATAVPTGTVWRDDGHWVEAFGQGAAVRGDRAKGETVPGEGEVVRMMDWLKERGGVAAAVGFGVGRP